MAMTSSFPALAARILPLLPLIFSSNVLSISWEWSNHLAPLVNLAHPISAATASEIFRRSYTNGAYSFLFSLLGSILSSAYLFLLPGDLPENVQLYYGWTAVFGVLHLFPFSTIILQFVIKACDGKGRIKNEQEVKEALNSWLRVNRWRMWMDFGGMCCALAAVVQRESR